MTLLLRRLERIEAAVGEVISAINRPAPKTVIRMPEVERRTGLKKSAIYALIQKKEFPAPVKIAEVTGLSRPRSGVGLTHGSASATKVPTTKTGRPLGG